MDLLIKKFLQSWISGAERRTCLIEKADMNISS